LTCWKCLDISACRGMLKRFEISNCPLTPPGLVVFSTRRFPEGSQRTARCFVSGGLISECSSEGQDSKFQEIGCLGTVGMADCSSAVNIAGSHQSDDFRSLMPESCVSKLARLGRHIWSLVQLVPNQEEPVSVGEFSSTILRFH
jgi:hypothetical protein